ncbi:MAG: DNA polymerase III subunit gamma/tau [Bacilli bacterium]|nr:DNA polymerase III subunit gamma/tau [Bacilli bacterium]
MYHALYRKYRPADFDSVVGQDAIIKTLKNSIINHNFSHAYMFFGPRGTGKTTVSKIFARNVNCLSPKDGIACGKCDACKASFSKDCIDILEIDAASNNGVNEIRELRNNVALVPSELTYKVYIVDEVHMLSDAAFNALLKTLEEPPEHVIFILATTDPQKVPETIISRCQCFSFKRISDDVIKERLKYVCKQEKIKIDDDVLEAISTLSDGGLRDALGALDKMVSYTTDKITLDDFNEVNGIISSSEINDFIHSILLGNIQNVLSSISEYNNKGKNLIQIMMQVSNYGRNMVVDYYLNQKELDIDVDLLQKFVNDLNDKMFDIKKSSNTKVYIEMFILKFINDNVICSNTNKKMTSSNDAVGTKEEVIEDKKEEKQEIRDDTSNNENIDIKESIKQEDSINSEEMKSINNSKNPVENSFDNVGNNVIPKILNVDEIMKVRINNAFATADKALLKEETANFELLKDYSFDQEIGYLVNSLLDSKLRVVGNNDMIISFDSKAIVEQNLVNLLQLNDVYEKITKSNKNIAIITDEEWEILKKEYISNLKNNVSYEVKEEPEVVLEEIKNDDIISSSAISLFGEDIVEIE